MKRFNWWATIVLFLISHTQAADHAKTQESDLKADAKDLLKAAASSAEYSTSLAASDYSTSEKHPQDNVLASSSSISSSVDSGNYNQGNYNQADQAQSQYSQPLSYSQPGTPVQPIHSYSQPLNYASQALPYTVESQQIAQQYGSADSDAAAQSQYQSIKDLPNPEIPSASASSSYYPQYPQYPAHQSYNAHLVLQQQASSPVSDYNTGVAQHQADQQYDSNQATYVQPAQHQQVYLHHQHHVQIPGSSYSEQYYVVDDKNGGANGYQQASSYSQPLPPEYSPEYSSHGNVQSAPIQAKPKKTVILAIPVKLVAKNKYSGGQNNGNGGYQNNGNAGYESPREIPSHYSSNVVPAAANLPVAHSNEKNNYYSNEGDKSFQEKPLYAEKPAYTDKVEEYPKLNHNSNGPQNNGYSGGEYEQEGGNEQHYRGGSNHGSRYNSGPYKQNYNLGREVKPLSYFQSNRPRKLQGYGPEIYSHANHGPEYTTNNGPGGIDEEYQISPSPDHGSGGGYSVGEIENNHIHALPAGYGHKHKINEVYDSPVDHLPPPYIPTSLASDFASLGGPSLGGSLHGLGNPMDLIYSNPYKFAGPPKHASGGYGYRPSLLGSASSQSPSSASSASNYGQFLSSLLSAYSLGSLKPSASKPSSSKGGLAGYLNNLPGLDLLKGYNSMSPSYSNSLLTSASGLNKYYLPKPAAIQSKPNHYLGWPSELTQPAKPKPTGLLASSSNIVSSIDELFKSSLNPTSKFRKPLYSDATRAITNLYKKFLN